MSRIVGHREQEGRHQEGWDEKGTGSGALLLAHFPLGLGPILEWWGAGGCTEDADGGAEGPISLPE